MVRWRVLLYFSIRKEHDTMVLDIQALARRGAEARIAEITDELQALRRMLGTRQTRTVAAGAGAPARRKRKPMTEAQKRAVGIRMKKYWAARRKANA